MAIALAVLDADGRVASCSAALGGLLGVDPAVLSGTPFAALVDPAERDDLARDLARLGTGDAAAFERVVRAAAAGRDPLRVRATALGAGAGAAVVLDAVGAVDAGETRDLRAFVEYAPIAIAMFDRELRYLAASERWRNDYGLDGAPLEGRSHYDVFPEISEHWRSIHRTCLAGATARREEDPFVRADGSTQWIRWAIEPWRTRSGDVGGIIIFSEDVSGRKRAELDLRDSEERLRLALDASTAGVWTLDVRTDAIVWDARTRAIFGLAPDAPVTRADSLAAVLEPDGSEVRARLDEVIATPGDDAWDVEFRVARRDGSVRWVQSLGRAQRDAAARVTTLTGIVLDVTERRRVAEALDGARRREQDAAREAGAILETAAQGIVTVDDDGTILAANAAATAMFAWPPGGLVGVGVEQLLPDDLRARHVAHRRCFVEDPRSRPMGTGLDLVARRRDGSTFPVEVSLSHFEAAGGRRSVAFVSDISARKEIDEELRRSRDALAAQADELVRRAERLRQLASDLTVAEQHAHEQIAKTLHDHLQQLLFSATMKIDRLARRQTAPDDAELLGRARGDVEEAIAMARSLSVDLAPPALRDGLPQGLAWLAASMREKYGLTVEASIDPAADPPGDGVRVLAFESVRELLFNVVKHAGIDRASLVLALAPDGTVRIEVADAGAGFDPGAVLVDGTALGRGLGLVSIRERMLLLGGTLDVGSAPGAGSRFTLQLPRDASPAEPDDPAEPAHAPPPPLRILIADDHAYVRDGLRELLSERPELSVVGEAATGVEAVARAHALLPDVIVMDVSMPQMDGVEATRRIRAELPGIRVLGLSTQERTRRLHAIEEAGADGCFLKGDDAGALVERLLALRAGEVRSAPG